MPADILLVGLPRSGTSWVGSVLGASPSIEYLREPITQSWLDAGNRTPLVNPLRDDDYRRHVGTSLQPTTSRRLIKEVNPLLIPYALDESPVQVILLRRHPCAVALSYHERGWTRLDVEERFGIEAAGDFWRDHGAYQALLLGPAATAIKGRGLVISYEALTRRPEKAFAGLATELDLVWDAASSEFLRTTLSSDDRSDPYAVRRDAAHARERWRSAMSKQQQNAVLAGFNQHRNHDVAGPKRPGRWWRRVWA
jgi:hypothetical protein